MAVKSKADILTDITAQLASIAALLADNISQDISEEDMRDVENATCAILTDIKDSFLSVPAEVGPAGLLNGTEELVFFQGSGEAKDSFNRLRNFAQKSTTGMGGVVRFDDGNKVHGTTGAPEVANITADHTNAVLDTKVLMIHQAGVAPTFGAEFKKTSGAYNTAKLNFIKFTYINATHILYTIEQF